MNPRLRRPASLAALALMLSGCRSKPDASDKTADGSTRADAGAVAEKIWKVGADCTQTRIVGEDVLDVCSSDGTAWLQCRNGKLEAFSMCRGEGGCRKKDGIIRCSATVGVVGEPCIEKATACSQDGTRVLECTNGKLVEERTCGAGTTCKSEKGATSCVKANGGG